MDIKTKNQAIIQAENLAGGYNGNAIWNDANFSIGKGEFVAVLGPNGAGKTTLFRMLLGLTKPVSGSITLLGEMPKRGNPRIGYVPQRHAVDSDTAVEALEFVRLGLTGTRWGFAPGIIGGVGGIGRGNGTKEALEALEAVQGTELAHRALGKLSGGELQRVFLAQALVSKPDILLLDEPLANLDIRRESNLVLLIAEIVRSQNVTVLLIAHNINPLLSVLDNVLYVANGRIAIGSPESILTSESLTKLYGLPIEVLRDSLGRLAIIGIEEPEHHENSDKRNHVNHSHE